MEISDERILAAMNVADDNTKKVLTALFGQEKPSIMDRIKTFEDACNELDEYHPYVVAWQRYKQANSLLYPLIKSGDIEAYLRLRIIAAALNEGWEPRLAENEKRCYAWFYLYSQKELDDMDEEKKKKLWPFGVTSFDDAFPGIACSYSRDSLSNPQSFISPRLAVKSEELAKYFGQQFIDTWIRYITM